MLGDRVGDHILWESKDGRKIPVSQLEDNHLINILKLLERRYNAMLHVAIDRNIPVDRLDFKNGIDTFSEYVKETEIISRNKNGRMDKWNNLNPKKFLLRKW